VKRTAVLLWVLAPLLLALSLYRPFEDSSARATRLPARVGQWLRTGTSTLTDDTYRLLGTRDAAWWTFSDGQGHEVYLVAVFHGLNWKSAHPPRICIEGSNMTILAESEVTRGGGAGHDYALLRSRSKRDGREYVSVYVYGTTDYVTPSYSSYFLHHAPRALLRRSTSGYLLRAECWAQGDAAAAEARCADFLEQILPMAKDLVR